MPAINPNLTPKVLRFVEVASALAKRATDELAKRNAQAKEAADMRGALLDFMIEKQAIAADQRGEAEKMLSSHASTMTLLKSAVDKIAKLKAVEKANGKKSLGKAAEDPEKRAGDHDPQSSLTNPFVGLRTSEKKASDLAFEKILQAPGA